MSQLAATSQVFHQSSPTGASRLVLIFDEMRTGSPDHWGCLSGWQYEFLRGKLLRAGLSPESLTASLLSSVPETPFPCVIVGFGEKTLRSFTDKKGIDKWQLSPLVLPNGNLFIPTFDFGRIQKSFELGLYLELALLRAAEYLHRPYSAPEERFLLNPGLEETFAVLDMLKDKEEVSVDVETGYGQINTVGFAWSPHDAIAINVLPDRCGDVAYFSLWDRIRKVLEGLPGKIFQNFMYDTSYFSAYGICTENIVHDTMHAMKVLWPELDMNLGNVGRLYTKRPYWKDDGRVESEEGKRKDWGAVRDWTRHYTYNCRDSTGTFEATFAQREDLVSRGLADFYGNYIQRLISPVREMCIHGMPVCAETRDRLRRETEEKIEAITREFQRKVGKELNPSSPKQIQKWLTEAGIELPKKYDKTKGTYRPTTESSAIKKIRLKNDLPGLKELQDVKGLDKALSSYLLADLRGDGRLPYSLNITGTETLRFSGGMDGWERGFNIQTIPREGGDVSIKSMFVAPEGYSFCEIDLRQAESRFVAYDSADKTLIDMLESGADVHTHVGKAILRQMGRDPDAVPRDEFKTTWRQLGKKAGHGLNYGMKAKVFVETVFNELDIVISVKDAELITKAYYGLFPGIPRWHAWLRSELYSKRKFSAPSGWERYFYGRYGDDMFKEAFAWRPQHTIPWITNHLMLHLEDRRKSGELEFNFITQVHDSLILLVPDGSLRDVALSCLAYKDWHPKVILAGGQMLIPTEVKVGKCMAELEEFHA